MICRKRVFDAQESCRFGSFFDQNFYSLANFEGGTSVKVQFSKTNISPTKVVMANREDELGVDRVLCKLLAVKAPTRPDEPVITMSYQVFNTRFQALYAKTFGSSLGISSHSLRRGGTTELVAAGVPEIDIMLHGRWVSSAWREYIDLSAEQRLRATRALQRKAVA